MTAANGRHPTFLASRDCTTRRWEAALLRAILFVSIGLFFHATRAGAAGTFYVDNSSLACSNSGPGTEAQPYCTISAAVAARGGQGTTIIVKPGVYREQVSIPSSGASGSPFVIKAQGPGVVVDGADVFANPALWSSFSGSVWLAASVTWAPQQVFVDGARLTPSTADPALLPANAFEWVSGQGLYVNLGGDNPGLHQTLVGRRFRCFNMFTKSWITIDGFTALHADDRGIYLNSDCTNITVAHNAVSFSFSYGIQVIGGSDILIDSNVVSDNGNHGIGLIPSLISGATNCTIRDNESFRNSYPPVRQANGIYLFGSPGNVLYGNRLHDNQDSGVNIESGSNNCISYNNVSWSNGDHGFDQLFATGTINVNDVAYGNYRDGFSIEGAATGTQLHNCIAVNNGLTTNEFDLWITMDSTPGFVSDYNLFWNSTSQAPISFVSSYSTVAAYSAASGQDAHSIQLDPLFVNPAVGNFHLRTGSPAVDAADSGAPNWPVTDAEGMTRADVAAVANSGAGPVPFADLGAHEYQPSLVGVPEAGPTAFAPILFPNPMRDRGLIRFGLSRPGRLRIQIFDLGGRVVRTLADQAEAAAGDYELRLDGRTDDGSPLGPGMYFYRVQALEGTARGRFLLVR